MKKLLLFAVITILMIGCAKKKDSAKPTSGSPLIYRSIPHWKADTLIGELIDSNHIIGYDTVYTYIVAGATKIKHSGIEYDIKTAFHAGDDSTYPEYLSTVFLGADSLMPIWANPYEWYQGGVWNFNMMFAGESPHVGLLIAKYVSIFSHEVNLNVYVHY